MKIQEVTNILKLTKEEIIEVIEKYKLVIPTYINGELNFTYSNLKRIEMLYSGRMPKRKRRTTAKYKKVVAALSVTKKTANELTHKVASLEKKLAKLSGVEELNKEATRTIKNMELIIADALENQQVVTLKPLEKWYPKQYKHAPAI